MRYTNDLPAVRLSREVLDADSFESLASQTHQWVSMAADHVVIDLTGVKFIYPAAVVELIMLCRFIHQRKGCTPVIKLQPGPARNYLESRGALDLLAETAEFVDVPGHRRRSAHRSRAVPERQPTERVMLISEASMIQTLVDRFVDYLARRDGPFFSQAYAFDVCIVLSELLHNVLDHNPAGTFAIFLMEMYRRRTESLLTLAIGDMGVGIMTSLRRNPRYGALATDTQAISTAIEFGTSEFAGTNRGNGLFFTLKILTGRGAVGDLRSGKGRLEFRPRRVRKRIRDVSFLPGTIFSVSLPSGYRQLTIPQWRKAS